MSNNKNTNTNKSTSNNQKSSKQQSTKKVSKQSTPTMKKEQNKKSTIVTNTTKKAVKANIPKPKKEKALDHKCPGCGAPIFFNPTLGKWKCEYCDSAYTLEEMQKYNNASSIENNTSTVEHTDTPVDNAMYVSYKCKNCGAEIVADEQTAATFCVYCGNTAILKEKLAGEFTPNYIIPFKKEKDLAIKKFKELSKGRPFMPTGFNDQKNIEKIRGIYVPFWLYDLSVSGNFSFNAQRVKSWTSGDRRYTQTDYYKIYRTGGMDYKKVPVDGSTRFNNDIMNTLEPFDYKELVPYNHAYLSGFYAERFDVDGDTAIYEAVNRALASGREVMLNSAMGYSSKTVFEDQLKAFLDNKYYALLPIWMVNVKYQDKYYLFAMNGQSGEFIGDVPIDKKKVVIRSIITFIIVFAVVMLINYFIYLGGK